MLRPGELLIDDSTPMDAVIPSGTMRGLKPRDWSRHPCGAIPGVPQSTIPKIPRSDWSARIKELVDRKALLSNVRETGMFGSIIPSRDQNGRGYCWAHSTTSAALMSRALANLPYADLSAYAIACIIKNYRDEGGFNGESMKFLAERGCPTSEFWPQQSTSSRNDNPATWENAAKHKMTEFSDIPDRDFDQLMTHLILGQPCAIDENWWSHSICALDPVEIEPGHFGVRIWNSWGDSWSDRGMGVLSESKATPDGAIACRVLTASLV